jgi:hypothetical protein
MSENIIRPALFWNYNGKVEASWGLCWPSSSVAKINAYIAWCKKYDLNTVMITLNNDGLMSLFKPQKYMQVWDDASVDFAGKCILRLKAAGLIVAAVLWDNPAIPGAKYDPLWRCPDSLHDAFIDLVCPAINDYVDLFVVDCEGNRGRSEAWVEKRMARIKAACPGKLCGSHEQNVGWKNGKPYMTRRVSNNADFWILETSNHPDNGDNVSVATMVQEVECLVANAHGVPVIVGEHNTNILGTRSREQARAIIKIDGVYGCDGPG